MTLDEKTYKQMVTLSTVATNVLERRPPHPEWKERLKDGIGAIDEHQRFGSNGAARTRLPTSGSARANNALGTERGATVPCEDTRLWHPRRLYQRRHSGVEKATAPTTSHPLGLGHT